MSEPTTPTSPSGFPRWLKWALLGALALLVVGYGAIFLYAKVLNDSPDEFDESDLDAALAIDAEPTSSLDPASTDEGDETGEPSQPPADTAEPSVTEPSVTEPSVTEPSATEPSAPEPSAPEPTATEPRTGGDEQVWSITDESQVGYRVKEILFGVDSEGVGRTNQITGSFVVAGSQVVSGDFVVDVASIESDDGRRDRQFSGRIMSTDEFPEATFTLTEPIDLGAEPADGVAVTTTATGDLTLRGVTNPVTFDVTAEQQNGRIGVLGAIPVVFADYSIANPSISGITTEDDGLLEFVLVFESA